MPRRVEILSRGPTPPEHRLTLPAHPCCVCRVQHFEPHVSAAEVSGEYCGVISRAGSPPAAWRCLRSQSLITKLEVLR